MLTCSVNKTLMELRSFWWEFFFSFWQFCKNNGFQVFHGHVWPEPFFFLYQSSHANTFIYDEACNQPKSYVFPSISNHNIAQDISIRAPGSTAEPAKQYIILHLCIAFTKLRAQAGTRTNTPLGKRIPRSFRLKNRIL